MPHLQPGATEGAARPGGLSLSQSSGLDVVGVRAVVEGIERYIADLKRASDATTATGKAATAAGEQSTKGASGFAAFSGAVSNTVGGVLKLTASFLAANVAAQALSLAISEIKQQTIDYEAATAKLEAATGSSTAVMERYKDIIEDLATSGLPATRTQLALVIEGITNLQGVQKDNYDLIEQLAQAYARFAAVTGTDVVQNVSAIDDVLDAWNLTAGDAIPLLDILLASYQKWGATAGDSLPTLQNLAPAFQQLGISIEGAVAWVNMFADAGIKAQNLTLAFGTALNIVTDASEGGATKMKEIATNMGLTGAALTKFLALQPAEKFNQIVASIAAIPDPAKRAQVAIDLFGQRAGARLAEVLQTKNLKDFAIDLNDVAGSVQRAGETIEKSAAGQWNALRAAIQATAISVGQSLIPAMEWIVENFPEVEGAIALVLVALGALTGNFLQVGVGLAIFALQWEEIFTSLPAPVQDMALAVAKILEKLVYAFAVAAAAMRNAINSAIIGIAEVVNASSDVLRKASLGMVDLPEVNVKGLHTDYTAKNVDITSGLEKIVAGRSQELPGLGNNAGLMRLNRTLRLQQELQSNWVNDQLKSALTAGTGPFTYQQGAGGAGAAKEAAKTLVEGFVKALQDNQTLQAASKVFGKAGADAIVAFGDALDEGTAAAGGKFADSLNALLDSAKGVLPGATAMANDVAAAVQEAFATRAPADIEKAEAALARFAGTIQQARDASTKALEDMKIKLADVTDAMGSEGKALADALVNAISDGSREAVATFDRETSKFTAAANKAGVATGRELMDALAAAIRDGSSAAVSAALDAIAKVDSAMRARAQAVEDVNFLGEALGTALRRQADEQLAAALSGIDAQREAINSAYQDTADTGAQAARDSASAQIDALRSVADAQEQAMRDQIDAVKEAADAAIKARQKQADQEQELIDLTLGVQLDAIQAQLDAIEGTANKEKRDDLKRQLLAAWDPKEQARIQAEIRAQDRSDQIAHLRKQQTTLRDAAEEQKKTIKAVADYDVELMRTRADAQIKMMEDALDAAKAASDAQIKQAQATADAIQRAAEQSAQARSKANDAAKQAALKALDAEEKAARDAYANRTDDFKVQSEIRQLIEKGEWDKIAELIKKYYPEWETSGFTLGQQIVMGMKRAGVESYLQNLLGLIQGVTQQASMAGGVMQAAGGTANATLYAPGPTSPAPSYANVPPPNTLPYSYPVVMYAAGGLVTGPTHAILGESGTEVVLPMPAYARLRGAAGAGGTQMTIDLRGSQFTGSPAENASAIESVFDRKIARQMGAGSYEWGIRR